MNFSEMQLDEKIIRAVTEIGFETATQIQAEAIPVIMEGGDIIGRSSTGTGKTAAFGLPIIQMALENNWDKSSVLILSPTRELAVQISDELRKFCKYLSGISIATIYGGQPMDGQIRQLKTARIVVGTPGRVMDHLRRRTLKIENLKVCVLDEADEMLNMGFHDDIVTILTDAPENRQTVLFSATMPPAILKLTKEFQNEPQMIAVDGGAKTATNIEQSYYVVPQAGKIDAVKLLLEFHKPKRALIFVNTKRMADELSSSLNDAGFKSTAIHGDLKQNQRNSVMQEFKNGRSRILIATDVAARGIDVEDVEAVINYDIPQDNEYYVHRIGRTGRAGKAGSSFTLAANRTQIMRIRDLERFLKCSITENAIPSIESIIANQTEHYIDEIKVLVDQNAGYEYTHFIKKIIADGYDAVDVAAALYAKIAGKNNRLAKVRNIKMNEKPAPRRNDYADPNKAWVRVNIGSDDRIGPNFIVGAIVEATELSSNAIGKINIFDDHTDIEMKKEDAALVLELMADARIKQKKVSFTLGEKDSGNQTQNRRFGEKRFGGAGKRRDFKGGYGNKDAGRPRHDNKNFAKRKKTQD